MRPYHKTSIQCNACMRVQARDRMFFRVSHQLSVLAITQACGVPFQLLWKRCIPAITFPPNLLFPWEYTEHCYKVTWHDRGQLKKNPVFSTLASFSWLLSVGFFQLASFSWLLSFHFSSFVSVLYICLLLHVLPLKMFTFFWWLIKISVLLIFYLLCVLGLFHNASSQLRFRFWFGVCF